RRIIKKIKLDGREGVLALLSDSTNSEREGMTPSELSVRETLFRTIGEAPGRVIVAGFSTNIHRNQQIIDACAAAGRKLCVLGRSMEQKFRLARELGYIKSDEGRIVALEELPYLPNREVALLTTGSQGEPFSVLTRMAMGSFKGFEVEPGDTVILSSKFIPGNERSISNLLNGLLRRGARVVHEKNAQVHVSGHAYRGDLRKMIEMTRPKLFMPIHGERRQLDAHRRLAVECGVPWDRTLIIEDGETAEFCRTGISHGPRVETGRVFVDGKGIGDVGPTILRDRMHLGQGGMVVVVLVVNKQSGEIIEGPDLLTRGFALEEKSKVMMEMARKFVVEAYGALSADEKADLTEVETEVTRALRRCFGTTLERRPMIVPIVMEM
ncbi:MAG: ribonuclease J, partial [Myxococcales bacterium]|nr:ribonuclease J [Myxococcales bacterium]